VSEATRADELAGEISAASREQANAVHQINSAMNQIGQVTQGNAAASEEIAAASEELNAQAEVMKQSVRELVQLIDGHDRLAGAQAGEPQQKTSSHQSLSAARNSGRSAAATAGQIQSDRRSGVSAAADAFVAGENRLASGPVTR